MMQGLTTTAQLQQLDVHPCRSSLCYLAVPATPMLCTNGSGAHIMLQKLGCDYDLTQGQTYPEGDWNSQETPSG